jgi:cytochrome c-type biogenesis protein CcmH/NrfG
MSAGQKKMKSLALAITITTFVIALSLYFVVDVSEESDATALHPTTQTSSTASTTSSGDVQLAPVESMLSGLEQRLQQQPDDGKGWLLLAKSYRHLGRMDDARDAYKKAEALGSGDATVATQLYGLKDMETSQ